jgi:hypothetical protein
MHPTGFASLRSARLRLMRQPLGRFGGIFLKVRETK